MISESQERTVIQTGDLIRSKGGAYSIEGHIGKGGMGEVCKATNMKIGGVVAIKFILKKTLNEMDEPTRDATVKRFHKEAAMAVSVKHSNVIETLDFGFHEGSPFIVMEYFPGEDLGQIRDGLIEEESKMSWEWLGPVLMKVCDGMDAVHRINLMHRDLKPGNIMVSSEDTEAGTITRVKVVDFGLAKHIYEQGKGDELTQAGTIVGTTAYMAPEQFKSAPVGEDVDERVDLYAIGTIAYVLMTGELPFPMDPTLIIDTEALVKKCNEPPKPPSLLRMDLPIRAENVILKALATDPDYRYATAKEMKEDIAESLGRPQHVTREVTLGEFVTAAREKEKRRSFGKTIAALTITAVLGVGGYFAYQNRTWIKQKVEQQFSSRNDEQKPQKTVPKAVKKKDYVVTVKSRRPGVQVFRAIKVKGRWKDAEFLGKTPLTTVLSPGKHTLRLRKRGYYPRTVKVSEKNKGCTFNFSYPHKGWRDCK